MLSKSWFSFERDTQCSLKLKRKLQTNVCVLMKDASVLAQKKLKGRWDSNSMLPMMVMLSITFSSSWSYHGPAVAYKKAKCDLFYLYATAKSKTHVVVCVCVFSNKHETGLVY